MFNAKMYSIKVLIINMFTNYFVDCKYELILLHSADIFGRYDETSVESGYCLEFLKATRECIGGIPRMIHVIKSNRELNKTGKHVLFLFGGNINQGSLWFELFKNNISTIFMNLLKPDAYAVGANELIDSEKTVKEYIEQIPGIPALSVNINTTKLKSLSKLIKKSVLLNIGGKKIGIIGFTNFIREKVIGENIFDLTQIFQMETIALKSKGCDLIIALGAATLTNEIYMAKMIPNIDIIVGGMSQTLFYNGKVPHGETARTKPYPLRITNYIGKTVLIVHAYAYSKYLGRLNLTLGNHDIESYSGQPVFLSNDVPKDKTASDALTQFYPAVMKGLQRIVGHTNVLLQGGDICTKEECNTGNLITDSFIFQAATAYYSPGRWTAFAIALYSGNMIKNEVDTYACCAGNISVYNVSSLIPYTNNVVMLSVKGQNLWHVFESAAGARIDKNPSFLQASGIRVRYDLNKPVGHRLISLKTRCQNCKIPQYEDINREKKYKIITNTYVLQRSRASEHLETHKVTHIRLSDQEVLIQYLSKLNIVYPKLERRLAIIQSGTSIFSWHIVVSILSILIIFYNFTCII